MVRATRSTVSGARADRPISCIAARSRFWHSSSSGQNLRVIRCDMSALYRAGMPANREDCTWRAAATCRRMSALEVPAVAFRELSGGSPGTSSAEMRGQVAAARSVQAVRFQGTTNRSNAHMSHRHTRQFCRIDDECRNLLKAAMSEMGLSARAHDKILRVARTIADLDGSAEIRPNHLNEAINYRMLDRQLWT